MPAGPPPTTSHRTGVSAGASVPGPSFRSRPAPGLTVQAIGIPLKTRPMQPWLPRMQ
jgi:hypothetical protein